MICPSCGFENIAGIDQCDACMADLRDLDISHPKDGIQKHLMEDPVRINKKLLKDGNPITISITASVLDAIHLMQKFRIGAILVLDHGKLAGIFTERDVLFRLANSNQDLSKLPIRSFMTADPSTLDENDILAYALHKMCVGGFRHIPILRNQQPIGVISVREVLRHLCEVAW